jgi:hypothetical protein
VWLSVGVGLARHRLTAWGRWRTGVDEARPRAIAQGRVNDRANQSLNIRRKLCTSFRLTCSQSETFCSGTA